MKISVADIRKKKPCYDPTEIKGITEDTSMELVDWLEYKAEKLIDTDKVWLASRFMTDTQCRVFAIWCARSCKTGVKEIKDYIDAIDNYYISKTITQEELMAAYGAAYRAADSAADRAAYMAADMAAYSAADRAVRKAQVKYLIKMLKEA